MTEYSYFTKSFIGDCEIDGNEHRSVFRGKDYNNSTREDFWCDKCRKSFKELDIKMTKAKLLSESSLQYDIKNGEQVK